MRNISFEVAGQFTDLCGGERDIFLRPAIEAMIEREDHLGIADDNG